MAVEHLVLRTHAHDPHRLAAYWAQLLDREVVDEPAGPRLPGPDHEVDLRFAAGPTEHDGPDRVHLHVTSDDRSQADTVARALELGGTVVDDRRLGQDHVVLADPEGHAFCVIEPGNAFLAGTGTLGELAGDGTRAVGVFWSEVLGWPLVWDEDGETAVQSPHGGTKVAWGGPPVAPQPPRSTQLLEVTGVDEQRLVELGAVRDEQGTWRDPDGNEFLLT